MLKLSFITNVSRWSTFNDKIGNVTFNLRVHVKYRITTMFLFFCIFRDRWRFYCGNLARKVFDFI